MILRLTFFLIALFAGLLPMHASAQGAQGERSSGVIGRMDHVEIRVFREDELTTRGQLSGDGTISMPLIGAVRHRGAHHRPGRRGDHPQAGGRLSGEARGERLHRGADPAGRSPFSARRSGPEFSKFPPTGS